jgi:hypothetical protein
VRFFRYGCLARPNVVNRHPDYYKKYYTRLSYDDARDLTGVSLHADDGARDNESMFVTLPGRLSSSSAAAESANSASGRGPSTSLSCNGSYTATFQPHSRGC